MVNLLGKNIAGSIIEPTPSDLQSSTHPTELRGPALMIDDEKYRITWKLNFFFSKQQWIYYPKANKTSLSSENQKTLDTNIIQEQEFKITTCCFLEYFKSFMNIKRTLCPNKKKKKKKKMEFIFYSLPITHSTEPFLAC